MAGSRFVNRARWIGWLPRSFGACRGKRAGRLRAARLPCVPQRRLKAPCLCERHGELEGSAGGSIGGAIFIGGFIGGRGVKKRNLH